MNHLRELAPLAALCLLVACGDAQPPAPAPVAAGPAQPAPSLPAPGGTMPTQAEVDASRAAYIRAHYTKFEFRVPARDGAKLFTAVYVPNDAGPDKRYPILLNRTPYTVAPYGLDRYRERLGPTAEYEQEGFIFAFQDVRGRHMSEGSFVNMTPHESPGGINESTDTHDTIDWLLDHVAHHNGKVGQWGISYPGFYTSAGAIDGHPALVAISPQAPIADWWVGDDMHRNGAYNLQLSFAFFSGFDRPRPAPTDAEDWERFDFGTPDAWQFYLDLGSMANVDARHYKGEIPFWKDVVAHPDYDAFWQARNILPHLRGIRAAVLVVGGWYDTEDLYGPLNTYAAIERQNSGIRNTLVMGPWIHGGWQRTDGDRLGDAEFGFATSKTYRPLELAFFKHHLKGGPDPKLPEALVFETGANRWREFDAWPPREVRERSLYLREAGALAFEAPTQAESFDEYVSDPARPVPNTTELGQGWPKNYMAEDQRFAARRPDVLVFQTAPLEHDLTLAGPIEVDLHVGTTGTDADWVVKLIDVVPGAPRGITDEDWNGSDDESGARNRGGQQTLVRGEPFRGRYRNDLSKPEPFVPGEPARIRFTVDDVFHTFQRGHRVMVQVQSTWFPFIDRNPQTFVPNIFEAKDSDFVKATHRVYHDRERPSQLTVRVLPAPGAPAP
jgi:putative CocE/NonD family hydrolase